DHVVTIQQRSFEVVWQEPIALLLIDGLHDHGNVERDFRHFEPWLDPAGYVAFHDYSGWYPGVVAFVDELIASGRSEPVDQADSLALLRPRPTWAPHGAARPCHVRGPTLPTAPNGRRRPAPKSGLTRNP